MGLKLLEISQKKETKQSQKIISILRVLSQKGSCTTWDMAKVQFSNDISKLRNREKEYRRLIIGRKSIVKQYPGLLEMGFIVKDGIVFNRGPATKYRLSLHGILFCIDALNLSDKEIDIVAEKYSTVIPKIFGKWKFLKTILNENVYKIRILARGLLLDNLQNTDTKNFIFY